MKPRTRPKDYSHTGHMGRIPVIAVAILFLIAAVLSALPSVEEWNLILHQYALAGFETAAETTRSRLPILGEYYDSPDLPTVDPSDQTSAPTAQQAPTPSHRAEL